MPVVAKPVIDGGKVRTSVKSETKLIEAKLHYTTAPHEQNRSRAWKTIELKVDGHHAQGAAPSEATVWYVAIRDERKAIVSSELIVQ